MFSPFSWLPDHSLNDKPFMVFLLTDHFCSSVRTRIKLAQAVLEDSLACVCINYMQIFYIIRFSGFWFLLLLN